MSPAGLIVAHKLDGAGAPGKHRAGMKRAPRAELSVWAGATVLALGGCTLVAGLDKDVHLASGSSGAGGEAATASATSASTGAVSSTTTGGVVCAGANDCPPDGPCETYACLLGQCAETMVNEGMQVPDPAGNCQKTQCTGGVLVTTTDPADFIEDGDPCSVDVCGPSGPTHDPGNDGALCGPVGHHCFGGACLECGDASQCPQGADACSLAVCTKGVCGLSSAADGVSCANASACKDAGSCSGGVCVQAPKSNGTTCNAAGVCAAGACCFTAVCGNGNLCCAVGQYCNAGQVCKP